MVIVTLIPLLQLGCIPLNVFLVFNNLHQTTTTTETMTQTTKLTKAKTTKPIKTKETTSKEKGYKQAQLSDQFQKIEQRK